MKNILRYVITGFLFCACSTDYPAILDLKASVDDIKRIELRADHKTLLPNGVAKMEFFPIVYGKKPSMKYFKDEDGKYYSETVEEEYLIPDDQLPKDYIKVYSQSGKEIVDNVYSTTDGVGSVLEFYAKGGSVESNRLQITIRPLPDESYEELIVPVIFHMLIPPIGAGPTYDISQEYLENVLEEVNDIFNRRITTDPNGGNLKVTFKLALYTPSGVRLQEAGKNVVNLTESNIKTIELAATSTSDISAGYKKFIFDNKSKYIWDPNKYLNIWLTRFSTTTSTTSVTYSYKFLAPNVIHSNYSAIPGLKMNVKDQFTLTDIADCLEVGCLINYMTFLNPSVQGTNNFALATVLGGYYGLLTTNTSKYSSLINGDVDYCDDTYTYYSSYYPQVYKANNLSGQPESRPLEWFTSFNVMDLYSRKNSISVDQALRMRMVFERCPSRWAYKSDFALTGKN